MPESEYDIIALVGTSEKSWEDAVQNIVTVASKTLRNLRIAEIIRLDAKVENQKIVLYRAKVKLSFKLEEEEEQASEPKEKKVAAKKAAKK